MLAALEDAATTLGKWVMLYPIRKTYKDLLNISYYRRKIPRSLLRASITISATVISATLMAMNAPESVLGLEIGPALIATVTALGSAAVASFLVKQSYRLGVYTWSGTGLPEPYIPVINPDTGNPIHITNTEYVLTKESVDKLLPTLRANIRKLIGTSERTPTDEEAQIVYHSILSQLIYDIHFPMEEHLKHKAKAAFQGLLNGSILEYATFRASKQHTLKEVRIAIENLSDDAHAADDLERIDDKKVPLWLKSEASQKYMNGSRVAMAFQDFRKADDKSAWIESQKAELQAHDTQHQAQLQNVLASARERAMHHRPTRQRLSSISIET